MDRGHIVVRLYDLFTKDPFHRYWNHVAYLDLELNCVKDEHMELVARRCHNVMSLSVRSSGYITDVGIQHIANECTCTHLEFIDLSRQRVHYQCGETLQTKG